MKIYRYLKILAASSLFLACNDMLETVPLDQLSTDTYWSNENDAKMALMGVYANGSVGSRGNIGFRVFDTYLTLDAMTDNGNEKDQILTHFNNGELTSSNSTVLNLWKASFENIGRANNLIENIDRVPMDAAKINMMKAEAKFLRAYMYFNLVTYWGDVPLVTKVLSIAEANSIERTSKSEVVNFLLTDLTEAISHLPLTRPDAEYGRVTKAGALAIKARILMAEKRWSEAAATYKEIIDSGLYTIDDDYKRLFVAGNERSNEIILAIKYREDNYRTEIQRSVVPFQFGGWHQYNVFNELVESYWMTDGKTIQDSPLYDPKKPYDNRDPRMDMSIFIPGRTLWKGQLFVLHPDAGGAWRLTDRDWSGYGLKKFADETHTAAINNYGGDYPMIRYAEILLGYLESKLEAGDVIDQNLLDLSINRLRKRATVNMPSVTETNPAALREIVRRERRIEMAFEGLRLYDLHRWGISHQVMKGQFHGMKLTDNPANYTALPVNENGYFRYIIKNFRQNVDYLWPIPQREIDINPNLNQNPGYN